MAERTFGHLCKTRNSRDRDSFCFCHQLLEAPTRARVEEEIHEKEKEIQQEEIAKYRIRGNTSCLGYENRANLM